MKYIHFIFLTISLLLISCGTPRMSESNKIVERPDVEAQFPGGAKGLKRHITKHIQYPEISMEQGEQGKVYVGFTVEKDGSLSDIEVLRGASKALDQEAIRMVSEMPEWTPAIYKGKYVRAKVRFPINYVLK